MKEVDEILTMMVTFIKTLRQRVGRIQNPKSQIPNG